MTPSSLPQPVITTSRRYSALCLVFEDIAFVGNYNQFHNEIDLSGSEGLNGMILTASSLCDGFMKLDEEVANFHLPALGEHLTVFAQEHRAHLTGGWCVHCRS